MKKLTALAIIMACFSISTSIAQIKINRFGAIYTGAYTQADIDNHPILDIPGIYLWGSDSHYALECKVGSAGYGIKLDAGNNIVCEMLKIVSRNYCQVFNANIAGKNVFSVSGDGKVSAYNFITLVPKTTLKNAPETKAIPSPLQKIMSLNGVMYPLTRNEAEMTLKRTAADSTRFVPLATNQYSIGLRTEDVEKTVPEVVYTNAKGETGVAYNELVGLLVEAIKELKTTVTDMQLRIDELQAPAGTTATQTAGAIALHQNVPNPFNQETRIGFNIPQEVTNAQLFIYNLQGNQLKNMTIAERGENQITIQASEFTPGMYIYTLIADGKEVASKRMILTK